MVAGAARCILVPLLALLAAAATAPAHAHRLAPAFLELREHGDDRVSVRFKTPRIRASGVHLEPRLPAACSPGASQRRDTERAVVLAFEAICPGGIVGGRVGVGGLAASGTNAIVHATLRDGRRLRHLLTAATPAVVLPARERAWDVVRSYARLGLIHLATGIDHVLFVAGLVLLVRGRRRLIGTVTAFTLGHSVTLALAALGWVRPIATWVEIGIAASLVVLAVEVVRQRDGLVGPLARWPGLLAAGFGLVHGFGFAGALRELGLPVGDVPLALLAFNVGIELGQILLVVVLVAPLRALAARPGWLGELPATAIGSLGCFYVFDRVAQAVPL